MPFKLSNLAKAECASVHEKDSSVTLRSERREKMKTKAEQRRNGEWWEEPEAEAATGSHDRNNKNNCDSFRNMPRGP